MKASLVLGCIIALIGIIAASIDPLDTDPSDDLRMRVLADTVNPRLPPYSINQVIRVDAVLTNGLEANLRIDRACDRFDVLLQHAADDLWEDVARAACERMEYPLELFQGASDTVTIDFQVMDLPDGLLDGTYRIRLAARPNAPDDLLSELIATSNPFSVRDAPLFPRPVRFAPDVISTSAEEWRITFTPDGSRAYFARSDNFFPVSRQATIYETRLEEGRWSDPKVASFSGRFPDIDPFVTPDGSKLFFSSIRPVDSEPREDADVWYVTWEGEGWSEAKNAGGVNSRADELYPSVSADGTLYVASDRPGGSGGWDVYRSVPDAGGYAPAENLSEPVNTSGWEFNPAISPDESRLLFTGLNYPDGAGLGDLYMTRATAGSWEEPADVGPLINTAGDEYHPSFSPDGRLLFFVRRDSVGDIYVVSWPHREHLDFPSR